MTEQQKRQCFAYNLNGERCDKTANHRGDHERRFHWTDADCYQPGPAAPPIPIRTAQPPAAAPAEHPTPCVACGHRHRGGECKCGCHEHIG